MISQKSIQEVINIASIQDTVGDFVNLRRRGINMIGLCPFHNEKTPSFTVSPNKNIYKCFGCGKGGNSVQFLMDHEQLSFPESIRHLAKRYGIELDETQVSEEYKEEQQKADSLFLINEFAKDHFVDNLWESDEGKSIGLSYYKKRGFLESTIKQFELGYGRSQKDFFLKAALEKNYNKEHIFTLGLSKESGYDFFRERVIFPIHNLSGKVIGFGGRTLSANKKTPKYLNSSESDIYNKRKSLYGLFQAKKGIRQEDVCILVEGYTDTISLHQAGINNVVAASGTSLTIDQIKLIKRYTDNVTVLFDGDAAGIKAAMRGMNLILEQDMNIKMVLLPEGEDPDSHLNNLGTTAFKEFLEKEAKDFIIFQTQMLSEEAGNDPIKKSVLLKDIVTSISKIPDTIKRSLYIQQTAHQLDISEQILIKESNKYIKQDINRKKIDDDRNAYQSRQDLPPQSESQDVTEEKQPRGHQNKKTRLDNEEEQEQNIARLIINHGDKQIVLDEEDEITSSVAEFVYDTIAEHLPNFINPICRLVIEEAHETFKSTGKIDPLHYTNHQNIEIQTFAVGAIISPYEFANWQERGAGLMTQKMPDENFFNDAKDSLVRYVLIKLIKKIKIKKDELKKMETGTFDASQKNELLKKIMILQNEKKLLSQQIDTNSMYNI